jgi:hypothetical protein
MSSRTQRCLVAAASTWSRKVWTSGILVAGCGSVDQSCTIYSLEGAEEPGLVNGLAFGGDARAAIKQTGGG